MRDSKRYIVLTALIVVLTLFVMGSEGSHTGAAAQQATQAATGAATGAPTEPAVSAGSIANSGPIPQYGLFETQVSVDVQVKNAFDPAQIDVTGVFTAPDGTQSTIPAFWMQPYQQTCNVDCSVEILKPGGQAGWRVRFSPALLGNWTYKIQVNQPGPARILSQGQFTVISSRHTGFVRVGKNHHYFGYDNGAPYFLIGTDLGWSWSGTNGTLGYQNWLKRLHDVGANYARLYVDVPWFIGLDWKTPPGDYTAAQEDAWRLDTILQTAEEQGIALQIVLLWSQGFTAFGGLPVNPPPTPSRPDTRADWASNPYNLIVGGPFNSAAQYFATDTGRTFFKNYLRYILARWGYSTSVFAWEVIDQLDRIPGTTTAVPGEWLREMVNYLRQNDPYQHLITAGVRDSSRLSMLDRAVLDFSQVRYYQRRPVEPAIDQVPGTLSALSPLLSGESRPAIINEFSLNPWFEPTADDPTGIHVRQTVWATALSGSAGGAASWWWDTYLFPQNLIDIYAPLAAFTRDIPWNTGNLEPVSVSLIGDASIAYQPLKISGYNGTLGGPRAPDLTYRVTADGVVPPITNASSFLYGVTYNTQLDQPHKYIITPPTDTKMTIFIRRVSDRAAARLVVLVDGKTVAELALSPRSDPIALAIPISAGEHNVVLDNLGEDYLQIDSIEIAQYVTPLRTLALADRTAGILLAWLQNRDYTWQNAVRNVSPKPVTMSLRIGGMPPGMYRVELWDPVNGNVVGQENLTIPGTRDGMLAFDLLPVAKSLAVRAIRVAEPANAPSPTPTWTPTPRILSTPATPATPGVAGASRP